MEFNNIKAIIFDSGWTLNGPRTGHWFITPNFMDIISRNKFECSKEQMFRALDKASDYLNKILLVKSEEEEFLLFKEFYKIVLKEVNYPKIDEEIIDSLARDNVYNDEKFVFFDDVRPALKKLHDKYLLGVVSDTWPSLERVFINNDLRKYFKTFVMSSVYGSNKSEKILFKIAVEELEIKPEEAVFVDDNENNLKCAEEFGMVPILIDRGDSEIKSKYKTIKSIGELVRR